jgi:hypothetical protein
MSRARKQCGWIRYRACRYRGLHNPPCRHLRATGLLQQIWVPTAGMRMLTASTRGSGNADMGSRRAGSDSSARYDASCALACSMMLAMSAARFAPGVSCRPSALTQSPAGWVLRHHYSTLQSACHAVVRHTAWVPAPRLHGVVEAAAAAFVIDCQLRRKLCSILLEGCAAAGDVGIAHRQVRILCRSTGLLTQLCHNWLVYANDCEWPRLLTLSSPVHRRPAAASRRSSRRCGTRQRPGTWHRCRVAAPAATPKRFAVWTRLSERSTAHAAAFSACVSAGGTWILGAGAKACWMLAARLAVAWMALHSASVALPHACHELLQHICGRVRWMLRTCMSSACELHDTCLPCLRFMLARHLRPCSRAGLRCGAVRVVPQHSLSFGRPLLWRVWRHCALAGRRGICTAITACWLALVFHSASGVTTGLLMPLLTDRPM